LKKKKKKQNTQLPYLCLFIKGTIKLTESKVHYNKIIPINEKCNTDNSNLKKKTTGVSHVEIDN